MLGIDDGPFTWGDPEADVVGVLMRGGSYVEAVLRTRVMVDGTDATDKLVAMLAPSRYLEQLHCLMLDGACLGGFNVVDLDQLRAALGVPVLSVTRDPPDRAAIEAALRKHFPDAERRLALLGKHPLHRVETEHNPLWVQCVGLGLEEARGVVKRTTIRGVIPEPVRVAHLIAAAMRHGESRGRA